ncbi:hypothetical protein KAR91_16765 [Candidatus Pacearchaeota archaeon]|nr:hypothetical protein [Candidatus Pacearchaeota archaeon]
MKSEEALRETGKAKRSCWHDGAYIWLDEHGQFLFVGPNKKQSGYNLKAILDNEWYPHHEEKEIRPENAGELWVFGKVHTMTVDIGDGLRAIDEFEDFMDRGSMVHGEDGWTRLYPPVEEDVERIEIEGVICTEEEECVYKIETIFTSPQDLSNKPMKVILEFTKGKS